jgi:hypothetical protein
MSCCSQIVEINRIQCTSNTAMMSMVNMMALIRKVSCVDTNPCDWVVDESGNLSYDGVEIDGMIVTVDMLGRCAKGLIADARRLLEDVLLFGSTSSLPWKPNAITDHQNNHALGYGFLTEHANQQSLFRGFCHLGAWMSRNMDCRCNGQRMFLHGVLTQCGVNQWMESHESWMKMLFVLLHLTGGQPARSTEYNNLVLTNTCMAPRNWLWIQGHLALRTLYNKTGDKKIYRFAMIYE